MADTWREVTETDVLTVVSGTELESYRAAALASGQADPIAALISSVVREARGRIAANDKNRLADGETLPAAVIGNALILVRHKVHSRLPIKITELRQREYEDAQSFFRDVARGLVAIDQPEQESEEDVAGIPGPSFTKRCRPDNGI